MRRAAYEIIARKGATNHAIGLVTAAFLRTALRNERRIMTVSRVQEGACGIRDVAISLPSVVERQGVTEIIEAEMEPGREGGPRAFRQDTAPRGDTAPRVMPRLNW